MLTIFSCPKPFRGHINIIQRNAIKSWTSLQPRPEIILIGDEEGTAEVCKEFGLWHIANVECNDYGTPLVNSLFSIANSVASNAVLCYVNADIILMSDFMEAIKKILKYKSRFLMVGQRWDLEVNESLNFSEDWQEKLKSQVKKNGKIHSYTGIDYLIFPKGLFQDIPPFALGRTVWDNWLVYKACSLKIPVIDITESALVIHQNHDFSHSKGKEWVWKGPEAQYNLQLAGGHIHAFTILDAHYKLRKEKLIHNFSLYRLYYKINRLLEAKPLYYKIKRFVRNKLLFLYKK